MTTLLSSDKPSMPLRGEMSVPGDKSITHRGIILGALAEGKTQVTGYLPSEDCERTMGAFRAMGVSIEPEIENGVPILEIIGAGLKGLKEPKDVIDCGNSGTSLRLLSGLLSAQPFFSVLTGDDSLRSRPMRRIVDPLREMGAELQGRAEGKFAPLAISGKRLKGIRYQLPVASAQVKSAILLAGLMISDRTTVEEPSPCRDHTERMFSYFGIPFSRSGNAIMVKGGDAFSGQRITVPGDFSSAAFFLVAASIVPGSDVVLKNVGLNETRTGLLTTLIEMGADIQITNKKMLCNEPTADLRVRYAPLRGIDLPAVRVASMLDEFPIFCIAAAAAEGKTEFHGAKELRHKESDRIETMAAAIRGMGCAVETFEDGMCIEGGGEWQESMTLTGGDHRVAMAMSIADLRTEGRQVVDDLDCINTSFPGFFERLTSLRTTEL